MTKDLLLLDEEEEDMYKTYAGMQMDNTFTNEKDEKQFIPQIKNNKISKTKPKENKKTV